MAKVKFKVVFFQGRENSGNDITLEAELNTKMKAFFEKSIEDYNQKYENGDPKRSVSPDSIPLNAKATKFVFGADFLRSIGVPMPMSKETMRTRKVILTQSTTLQDILDNFKDPNVIITKTDLQDYVGKNDSCGSVYFE